MALVYLNGEYLPEQEACVPVLDRGFIFGDGIYEVIPCYGAHPFRLDEHLQRLSNNLAAVRIPNPLSETQWSEVFSRVLQQNGAQDQAIYCQITRGVAKRDHAIPTDIQPTVFVMANLMQSPAEETLKNGVDVITCNDNRWTNCHIKTTSLLANVLLRQQAVEQGATEAVLVRDGYVTEGAASNVFMVQNGVLITAPKSGKLLPGITRDLILELAKQNSVPCEEREFTEQELLEAEEVWISSSTKEILPVTRVNGQPISEGEPGPLWQSLYRHFQTFKQGLRDA